MAPEEGEDGGESESPGGLDEELSSGGSSLEDEEAGGPELLPSGSSESDFDELLLSRVSPCLEEIALLDEPVSLSVCFNAARDLTPGALTHLG
jgi:hypothetical protein